MDIATGLGFLVGIAVLAFLTTAEGSASAFVSEHALIVIFGGCTGATLIRFLYQLCCTGFQSA